MKNRIINIIGAGISGVVAGRVLAENGYKIKIFEKRPNIGGNLFDFKMNDVLVHKYGPHIFHTSKKEVINFVERFWKLNGFKNVVEGYVDNKLVPIPFNFQSIDICFPEQKDEIKKKLLDKYKQDTITILELRKDDDPVIQKLAEFIYKNLFLNYTTKMWNLKPDEIDESVTARIPVILSYKNTYFNDVYEGLPEGGYTKAIEKMLDHPNIEVTLNIDANKMIEFDFEQNKMLFDKKNELVIYTGPIDKLFNNKYGVLDYRSLHFEFETFENTKFQKTAVVNYPDHKDMTRITEYKNMTLQKVDNTVISKEFPGTYDEKDSKWNEPYYPLATENARKKYEKYKELANNFSNLLLLGRMATYKYINMDQAIEGALHLAKEIINNNEK